MITLGGTHHEHVEYMSLTCTGRSKKGNELLPGILCFAVVFSEVEHAEALLSWLALCAAHVVACRHNVYHCVYTLNGCFFLAPDACPTLD